MSSVLHYPPPGTSGKAVGNAAIVQQPEIFHEYKKHTSSDQYARPMTSKFECRAAHRLPGCRSLGSPERSILAAGTSPSRPISCQAPAVLPIPYRCFQVAARPGHSVPYLRPDAAGLICKLFGALRGAVPLYRRCRLQ